MSWLKTDLGKAALTVLFAILGVVGIMTWAMDYARAFQASDKEAAHCGLEGGCVIVSQQWLSNRLNQARMGGYEQGIREGLEECNSKS